MTTHHGQSRFAHGPTVPCPSGHSWEGGSPPEAGQEEMELCGSCRDEVAGGEHRALPGGRRRGSPGRNPREQAQGSRGMCCRSGCPAHGRLFAVKRLLGTVEDGGVRRLLEGSICLSED